MDRQEFEHQLRGALRAIHDYVTLQNHPLATLVTGDSGSDDLSRARRFRRALLEAIEDLAPPADSPIGQRQWRGYHILTSRYIEGHTSEETWKELAISERQYYREQQAALQALYDRVWTTVRSRAEKAPAPSAEGVSTGSLDSELERLVRIHDSCDPGQLLSGVVAAVRPLAEARMIRVDLSVDEGLAPIQTNRTVLRQVFIRVLSALAVTDEVMTIWVSAQAQASRIWITVRSEMASEPPEPTLQRLREQFSEAEQLARRIRGSWRSLGSTPWGYEIAVGLPTDTQRIVLAVEDNPSAIQLMRRYLAQEPYRLIHAESGEEALERAQETPPDLITLDIMLPNQDGWEILQTLRSEPALERVPIVLASVLAEPALTTAFDVAGYLKKPYTRQELIAMLEDVLGPED